jgi:hypothetical protein
LIDLQIIDLQSYETTTRLVLVPLHLQLLVQLVRENFVSSADFPLAIF